MPITEQQREARRGHIGSSDSPAIVGVDPWTSAADVFASKVYDLADLPQKESIDIGNDFELPLLKWAGEQLGVEIEANVGIIWPENQIFAANLDARAKGRRIGIEAKTTSMRSEWGDEGTDHVPERVLIQVQHQMMVADLDVVYVPVLCAEFDRLKRRMYQVDRNERLIEAVKTNGVEFWTGHVVPKIPPVDWKPSLETLKRIKRIEGEVVEIDAALVEAYEIAKATAKSATEMKDEAQAALIAALGEAEAGDYGDDEKIVTYREQGRRYVDGKRLATVHPDIAAEFTNESRFRVLRTQKR